MKRRLFGATVTGIAIALLLAACGSLTTPLAPSAILRANSHTKTVTLDLVASETGAYRGFNFDGYANGKMRVSVPEGWAVNVTCTNASTTLSNSCAVIEDQPLAPGGSPLAFRGASTEDPSAGLGLLATGHFRFFASHPGTYRVACLVDGYELDGMWDWFVVTQDGQPTLRT